MTRYDRLCYRLLPLLLCTIVSAAGAIPAGRFREHAEKVKDQAEGRAGVKPKPAEGADPAADPVLADIDKAKAQYHKTLAAADATALGAFDRQLQVSTSGGDLDGAKLVQGAKSEFESTGEFNAHDLPVLARAKLTWLKTRERAARDVLAAFDRGIKTYTRAKRLDDATALRREREAFARDAGRGAGGILPPGAVLHLTFEPDLVARKDGQSVATDASGAGNHGVLRGVRIIKDGARGSAAAFDGSATVDCGKGPEFQAISAGLTVAAFVRVADARTDGELLSKDDWQNGARGFDLKLLAGNVHVALGTGADWRGVASEQRLTPATWHHLAGTFDGKRLRLYIDGREVADQEVKGKIPPSTFPLLLGQRTFTHDRHFKGDLDEVTVFARPLSPEEIQQLAARP
jgi:hypothetical protein